MWIWDWSKASVNIVTKFVATALVLAVGMNLKQLTDEL